MFIGSFAGRFIAASSTFVPVVLVGWVPAANVAHVGLLTQMTAAATSVARTAAHNFVQPFSGWEDMLLLIRAKVHVDWWLTVLCGHVLGIRIQGMRLVALTSRIRSGVPLPIFVSS